MENKITYYYDARSTIHYNKLYEAIYVEELFPKSYCSFANMLLLFTWWYSLLQISFSKTFEKDVSNDNGL